MSGRMWCTACATAIADSAKPVAISLSLPSNVVMSPHAHTRSRLVSISAVDHDRALLELEAPLLERPELGREAELEQHRVALEPLDRPRRPRGAARRASIVPLPCDLADHVGDACRSTRPASTWPMTSATVASWARKPSRRCTSVTSRGGVEQVHDPVEGGVAAADDHDALAGELALVADEVVRAAALPRRHVDVGDRQLLGLERAVAAGDDHRARAQLAVGRCAATTVVAVVLRSARRSSPGAPGRRTARAPARAAARRGRLASTRGWPGHVEDPLLRDTASCTGRRSPAASR